MPYRVIRRDQVEHPRIVASKVLDHERQPAITPTARLPLGRLRSLGGPPARPSGSAAIRAEPTVGSLGCLEEREIVEAHVAHLLAGEDDNDLVARVEDAPHVGQLWDAGDEPDRSGGEI